MTKLKTSDDSSKKKLIEEWLSEYRQVSRPESIEFTEQDLKEQMLRMEGKTGSDMEKSILNWGNKLKQPLYIDPETRLHLCSLLKDSGENIDEFKVELESWFKHTMARSIGWYKKKISYLTFVVGLIIAINFNVDTIYIAKELKENTAKREALMVQVEDYHRNNTNQAAIDTIRNGTALDSTQIDKLSQEVSKNSSLINESLSLPHYDNYKKNPLSAILGWILTAIAISFGAPFWFDLLNKLMQLRSSIKLKPSDNNSNDQGSSRTASKGLGKKRMG